MPAWSPGARVGRGGGRDQLRRRLRPSARARRRAAVTSGSSSATVVALAGEARRSRPAADARRGSGSAAAAHRPRLLDALRSPSTGCPGRSASRHESVHSAATVDGQSPPAMMPTLRLIGWPERRRRAAADPRSAPPRAPRRAATTGNDASIAFTPSCRPRPTCTGTPAISIRNQRTPTWAVVMAPGNGSGITRRRPASPDSTHWSAPFPAHSSSTTDCSWTGASGSRPRLRSPCDGADDRGEPRLHVARAAAVEPVAVADRG